MRRGTLQECSLQCRCEYPDIICLLSSDLWLAFLIWLNSTESQRTKKPLNVVTIVQPPRNNREGDHDTRKIANTNPQLIFLVPSLFIHSFGQYILFTNFVQVLS